MKRSLIRVLTCSATVLILGCRGSEPTPLEIGDLAPAFSLPAVGPTSGKLTSDQLQGKISVVNFWSTTCAVCLKETEDLARIHDSGKAMVIGIALDSDAEYLGRFVKERGIPYPVAQGDEDTFSRYDGYAVPYTLVLDRSRSVRKRVYGRIDEEDLKKVIDEIDRSTVALETTRPTR
jgi:cytochrome c biogenesis protein CcmG/thiol:disulfide interchange protein DsbE